MVLLIEKKNVQNTRRIFNTYNKSSAKLYQYPESFLSTRVFIVGTLQQCAATIQYSWKYMWVGGVEGFKSETESLFTPRDLKQKRSPPPLLFPIILIRVLSPFEFGLQSIKMLPTVSSSQVLKFPFLKPFPWERFANDNLVLFQSLLGL